MTITEFTENVSACASSDIVYSMGVNTANTNGLVSFNTATRVLTVVSSSSGDVGPHTITITGTITNSNGDATASSSFTLTVTELCSQTTDTISLSPPSDDGTSS